jgi:hypothetical protein
MKARKRPQKMRTEPGEASFNNLFSIYKTSARARGVEFNLSKEAFKELATKACHYCGEPPKPYNKYYNRSGSVQKCMPHIFEETANRQWIFVNGIDRLVSDVGYITDNCVTCCSTCNYLKSDSSLEDFLVEIKRIYEHMNLGNKS